MRNRDKAENILGQKKWSGARRPARPATTALDDIDLWRSVWTLYSLQGEITPINVSCRNKYKEMGGGGVKKNVFDLNLYHYAWLMILPLNLFFETRKGQQMPSLILLLISWQIRYLGCVVMW